MRLGSSCLSREPTRCSNTTQCDRPRADNCENKSATTNNSSSYKQYCPIRQWTCRSGLSAPAKAESTTSDEQASVKALSKSENLPQNGHFKTSFSHLKTLPSRPKANHSSLIAHQTNRSVEENKQGVLSRSHSEASAYPVLPLNRSASSIDVNVARSRCHPRRRQCDGAAPGLTPKLRRDTDCTEAIVRLIVFFSTKLVHTIWSQASMTPKSSKDFNGAAVLPLQVFIQETLRRSKTSYSTLQVALFYLILLRPHVRPCQGAQQNTSSCRALQCGRRMFLTALILASKYLQDRNYSARAWSKISGLPVAEINENERHYLELIKYNLHVSKETFENWSKVVLMICKASGQGPYGTRPDSPPSSPDSLACSMDREQPGSSEWWAYHLVRLTPDMIKDSKASEEYIAGLAKMVPYMDSSISLDTPPSSPESLEDVLSGRSSPLVLASTGPGQVPASELGQSPISVGFMPTRPLPPNLPTPQTTPRYDSAFTFSRQSSQSDLRCRASLQALGAVDKQPFHQANLETCPPPKPRRCDAAASSSTFPQATKDTSENTASAWMSSPESSFSDTSSFATRSRSSSISSVSSVWSVAGQYAQPNDSKQICLPRVERQASHLLTQTQARGNVGTYSYYHPVGNMQAIPENGKVADKVSVVENQASSQISGVPLSNDSEGSGKPDDLSDTQIAQLLASLSSQSGGQVHHRSDPAVIRSVTNETASTRTNIGPSKKHKRCRSSKEENVLQDEVRQFLWNNQIQVCVEDDKKPTTYVETTDKEAQYPLQDWAYPKKPVPTALHNKRIALQHSSSPGQSNASKLAAEFLRPGFSAM